MSYYLCLWVHYHTKITILPVIVYCTEIIQTRALYVIEHLTPDRVPMTLLYST